MEHNAPIIYDFDAHYRGDGLNPMRLLFKQDGEAIDFSFSTAVMQLRVPEYAKRGRVVWEFSTSATDPDKLLVLTNDGYVYFPPMNTWNIPSNQYLQDLQITDGNGVAKTFIKGIWSVNQDITDTSNL